MKPAAERMPETAPSKDRARRTNISEASTCANAMDIFDDTIREIHAWFRQKELEGKVRQYEVPSTAGTAPSSSSGSKRAEASGTIVLREDTHLELGHPSVGSCCATFATRDPSLVGSDRIVLLGPDIPETDAKILPFAQIALACCKNSVEETSPAMDRILHASAQIDGYMIRSVPNLIWARVSKEAARSGFSFRRLGQRLIDSLRNERMDIVNSEVFFVTSGREDVGEIGKIIEEGRARLRKLQTYERRDDGTYECTTGLDCDDCGEKPVCDTIREVITIRKGDRIITLGKETE